MIGEEIRRRRQEKGLTGEQLAAKAGMAPSAISQIETGRRSPHSESVMKLAQALECDVADLYPKVPRQLSLEDFPAEQVAAFLAESERDKEWMRRELEKLSANDIREMLLASPPLRRLSEAYRKEAEHQLMTQQERPEEVALEAARQQLKQDSQAAARALESGRAQTYFMRHENAAAIRLLQYPQDEQAAGLMELARRYVELEREKERENAALLKQLEKDAGRA
jgi:transcriptional regulator with XRE-family HTH domain